MEPGMRLCSFLLEAQPRNCDTVTACREVSCYVCVAIKHSAFANNVPRLPVSSKAIDVFSICSDYGFWTQSCLLSAHYAEVLVAYDRTVK